LNLDSFFTLLAVWLLRSHWVLKPYIAINETMVAAWKWQKQVVSKNRKQAELPEKRFQETREQAK